jgi:hypothetical protein
MLPPTLLLTVNQAGALAATAAMRLGVSVSVWDDADNPARTAALEAATADLYAEPGAQIYGRETDRAVQLACVVQALQYLDLQDDPNAQEHRRLQDQGVIDVQSGRNRLTFRSNRSALCAAARQCLRSHRGAVSLT